MGRKRIRGELKALIGPTGYVPIYDDLAGIFEEELSRKLTEELYSSLFTIRVGNLLRKTSRIIEIYHDIPGTPEAVLKILEDRKRALRGLRERCGVS